MSRSKVKTRRGAAKRFRVTKLGRIKKGSAYRRHIMSKMSTKRKRQLRTGSPVDSTNIESLKRVLPYSF